MEKNYSDENNIYLDHALQRYGKSEVYPFHMPGHKRQVMDLGTPENIDITEVDGFDNLHHAEGIIADAQIRMAKVFGADETFFLVNGSTCGLLAAISATVPRGKKILVARNCHKAVYHGIFLRGLSVEYVYPQQTQWGIQGSISPAEVEKQLRVHPDIQAVLITSPTYDGVVSDIEAISDIVHKHHIPLIVDEAHGAHFGFSGGFPKKAHWLGADVVIESIHKTLPAFTQSAALHVVGDRVNKALLKKYLGIYQTSSPSYIFMAGLDRCTRLLKEQGQSLMNAYEKKLEAFYEKSKSLKCLQVLSQRTDDEAAAGIFDRDMSKILIFTHNYFNNSSIRSKLPATVCEGGNHLAKHLLAEYGLQMEMESAHYITALTSVMDTQEGFDRLWAALESVDKTLCQETDIERFIGQSDKMDQLYAPKEKQMEIEAASECETKTVHFEESVGEISCEFAYLYPPGIPFLVPGEVITQSVIDVAIQLKQEGYEFQGLEDLSGELIKVAT